MLRIFCTLFLLIAYSSLSQAQDSSGFYHFTTENGLPSNNVYSVIKDRLGYIWVATDNGVAKYDGYEFKTFTTNDGLPTNDVWKLYEDNSGRIWLYSNSYEIGYIKGDRYYGLELGTKTSNIFPVGIVTIGNDAVFFIYIKHNKYYFGLFHNNRIAIIPIKRRSIKAIDLIRDIKLSEDGYLWLLSFNNLIFKINLRNQFDEKNKVIKAKQNTYTINSKLNGLICNKRFFYGFSYKGSVLKIFDSKTEEFKDIDIGRFSKGNIVTGYFKKNSFYVIAEKACFKIINKNAVPLKSYEIPQNSNISYLANFGDIWICTYNDGIWIKPLFKHLKNFLTTGFEFEAYENIGSNETKSYWWNNSKNTLLVIEENKVASKINLKGYGKLRYVFAKPDSLSILLFNTGMYRLSGNKLVSFFNKPLLLKNYYLSGTINKIDRFDDSLALTFYNNNYFIHSISDSSYLIFGHHSVDLLTEKETHYESVRILNERLTGFLSLNANEILCTYNTRNIFLFFKNFKKRIWIDYQLLEILGIKNIKKIVSAENEIYILTAEKLLKYNFGKSFLYIETQLNLTSSDLFITKNHLVLTGDFGIAVSLLSKHHTHHFTIIPNFKKTGYNKIKSTYADAVGNIFLTTDKHSYTLNLDSINENDQVYQSLANPQTFHLTNRTNRNLRIIDTFILNSENKKLTLNPINKFGSGTSQIFYRIGMNEWQKANSNEISLPDLKPDQYYKIDYFLRDDFWKSRIHTLYVLQLPQWYQKKEWQAIFLLAGLLFFGGSILIATVLTKKLVAKANEKRRLQTELELRAIHSQINPHFIFNTLSTALFFISKEQTKEAYEHVSKFARLLRNYLKSSRERFIILADEIEILKQYIELQKARFSKTFHYEILVADNILPNHILLPSMLLQPLVENAINHGLFNKGENGFLKLEFHKGKSDTELICIIEDNGIGRAKAKLISKRYKKEKNSYGTALTRELIDIFKRYEEMDINLEYVDKEEPETGTIVKLVISNVKITGMS